jgi:hypothetical protein
MIAFPRFRSLRMLLAMSLLAVHAFAPGECAAADPTPGLSGNVWIEEGFTDNLRADHILRTNAFFTALQGETWWQRGRLQGKHGKHPGRYEKPPDWFPHRFGATVGGAAYSEYQKYDFAEFGPSFAYDWDLVTLTVDYRYSPHHLRVDPSAALPAYADDHDLSAEFRSKFGEGKRGTAILDFDSSWEFYDKKDPKIHGRSYFQEQIEAGLRWRVTEWITPRASVICKLRHADSANYDLNQIGLLAGFDLTLPFGVRGILRYEHAWRTYPVDSVPPAKPPSNFEREDKVDCFESGFDVPFPYVEAAHFELRYRRRNNDSTRVDRNYYSNEAGLRLRYDFD